MNSEFKMNNTGIYPTFLNIASSTDVFQYPNTPSAELVDLSFCTNTFLIIEQPIEIDKEEIIENRALHITKLQNM